MLPKTRYIMHCLLTHEIVPAIETTPVWFTFFESSRIFLLKLALSAQIYQCLLEARLRNIYCNLRQLDILIAAVRNSWFKVKDLLIIPFRQHSSGNFWLLFMANITKNFGGWNRQLRPIRRGKTISCQFSKFVVSTSISPSTAATTNM